MKFKNSVVSSGQTEFTKSAVPDLQFSRFKTPFKHITDFNAGDIVPIYCGEVLPHDTFDMSIDFVCRQSTALVPTMGEMYMDIYAFFVPNRIVNQSWKNVQGENSSGAWVAPEVSLAPLYRSTAAAYVAVPPLSVADYYGFPTQGVIKREVLMQCHDLKFKGYLSCFNRYFRDENYEPPIAFSKMNVYCGFFEPKGTKINFLGTSASSNAVSISSNNANLASGAYGAGAVKQALYGDGGRSDYASSAGVYSTQFSALGKPLKANKLHDMFTSVLPAPQKNASISIALEGRAPVVGGQYLHDMGSYKYRFERSSAPEMSTNQSRNLLLNYAGYLVDTAPFVNEGGGGFTAQGEITRSNLEVDLSNYGISINDLRESVSVQQYYEILARSGSRYREYISAFFGLNTLDNFPDDPQFLGHFRRKLDLYQVAQTSASESGNTPQGNLSAFGYSNTGGHLFKKTFLEHGYVHVFAVVRHRNLYSSYLARDNFRLSALDYYTPVMANISEQPIYSHEFNGCTENPGSVFGYNEAWIEYRFEPDRVSGYMRPGIPGSLSVWNFADDYDVSRIYADNVFMKSNSEEVLNRTLAVTSDVSPQFNCEFYFNFTKERPMPVYSIPGLDIF